MAHTTRANVPYWIFTGLTAALMTLSAVPDVIRHPAAISVFAHLGYPVYLLPFLGSAKLLAVVALLVPGFGRLKEWAYAGLVIDLTGALYSHLSVGDPPSVWLVPVVGLVLVGGSWLLRGGTRSFSYVPAV
jgi:DoxX-like family